MEELIQKKLAEYGTIHLSWAALPHKAAPSKLPLCLSSSTYCYTDMWGTVKVSDMNTLVDS